jgi:hypothetical protein
LTFPIGHDHNKSMPHKLTSIVLAALLVSSLAFAGELFQGVPVDKADAPKSRDALDALAKLDGAKKRAKVVYDAEVKRATAVAVKELEAAKLAVMKTAGAGALDEANRIQEAVEGVKQRTNISLFITPDEHRKYITQTTFIYGWADDQRGLPMKFNSSGSTIIDGKVVEKSWLCNDEMSITLRDVKGINGSATLVRGVDGTYRGFSAPRTAIYLRPEINQD